MISPSRATFLSVSFLWAEEKRREVMVRPRMRIVTERTQRQETVQFPGTQERGGRVSVTNFV